MTEKERVKAQRKEYFKNATLKQKLFHFWEYYKIHTIVVVLIVIIISNFIYHKVTDPEVILYGLFLNIYNTEDETSASDLGKEFLELQDMDTTDYDVSFNDGLFLTGDDSTDYETSQAVWVQCAAGAIDFIVSPAEYLMNYAYDEYFTDLTTVLSEEQIEKYQPYFLYIDGAVVEEIAETSKDIDNPIDIALPDCAKPEEMQEPIPVLIDVTQCEKLMDVYGITTAPLVFGILVNAPAPDLTIDFLDYLME